MKIIFLDIDGVLVTSKSLESNGYNHLDFDGEAVYWLNKILYETNAKIVLSSNWRRENSVNQLNEIFKNNGIIEPILDVTNHSDDYSVMREDEIKSYLQTKTEITHYLILDDEEPMPTLHKNFIQTDFRFGIRKQTYEEAIQILN